MNRMNNEDLGKDHEQRTQVTEKRTVITRKKITMACQAGFCLLSSVPTIPSAQNTLPPDVHLAKFESFPNLCSNLIFSVRLTLNTQFNVTACLLLYPTLAPSILHPSYPDLFLLVFMEFSEYTMYALNHIYCLLCFILAGMQAYEGRHHS